MKRQMIATAIGLLVIAGCGSAPEGASIAPTSVAPETVIQTTTESAATTSSAETSIVETSNEATKPAADEAACRLISEAIDGSRLQRLADEQTAGSGPFYGDVVRAGREFSNLLGGLPTAASEVIQSRVLALMLTFQMLEEQYTAMPNDVDEDAIASGLGLLPEALASINDACE